MHGYKKPKSNWDKKKSQKNREQWSDSFESGEKHKGNKKKWHPNPEYSEYEDEYDDYEDRKK